MIGNRYENKKINVNLKRNLTKLNILKYKLHWNERKFK